MDDIKNKRIAILAPVAWRTPPRAYGAWETVAGNITEGLVARGWKNVTYWNSPGYAEYALRISTTKPPEKIDLNALEQRYHEEMV